MNASPNAYTYLRNREKLALVAYRDQAGVWTIGYGHTGPEVNANSRCTPDTAEAMLHANVARVERAIGRLVTVPLSQNQYDALVIFTFNTGVAALSTSTLLARVNARDFSSAANEFSKWNHVTINNKKVVSNGLTVRREYERQLFLTPIPEQEASCTPPPSPTTSPSTPGLFRSFTSTVAGFFTSRS